MHRGTGAYTGRRRVAVRRYGRMAFGIDTRRPGEFLDERLRKEEFSIGPIQNVVKPVSIRLHQKLPRAAAKLRVEQHRDFVSVPIVSVVWHELEIPLHL